MENIKIKILGNEIELVRLTLRGWTGLEGLKQLMDDAISNKDTGKYFSFLVQFIEMASVPFSVDWNLVPWYEVLGAYSSAITINSPSIEFPVLRNPDTREKKQPWEYDGRSWYFWLNLFAKHYGWDEKTIGELDIDTAIGLYQETLIDEQFHKEWEWGINEIAYSYNTSTKKSEFKALPRPRWMLPLIPRQLPRIKMRKDMMPVGN